VPLLETVGPVYQIEMLMNYNGLNHGLAFATFFTPLEASIAVENLNNYEIRHGKRIVVDWLAGNCEVQLVGVPAYKTVKEIYEALQPFFQGLRCVLVEAEIYHPTELQYAIAVFEDHS